MKKLVSVILTITMAFTMLGTFAVNAAEVFSLEMQIGNPVMSVNGIEQEIDEGMGTTPVIINERTLVPIRAIIEAMGGTVGWEAETRTATLNYGDDEVRLVIDSTTAYLNGRASELDTAPAIINDRTMLPIRFIAESFKFDVEWDGDTQTITIAKTQPTVQTEYVGTNEFDLEKATVILNNGVEMPIFGIGTFALSEEEAENSVYHALLDGYHLIDTANGYNNEEAVARGIKRAIQDGDINREDIFLTAKLWPTNYSIEGIDATLERLGVDYVDLMLLHQPFGDYVEGWKAMEQAMAEGKIRAIGLSNFEQPALWDEILEVATVNPAVLQVETHPYYQQTAMMKYLDRFGTVIEAWYPLGGRGNTQVLFNDPTIVEIAEAHNKSAAQVILRWHLQARHIAIPGSSNPDHIQENIEIFDFELSDDEMEKMTALDRSERFFNMPNSITPDEMEEYIMNAAADITGEKSLKGDKTMKVTIDNTDYEVELDSNVTADEIASKLPLNLTLTRYGGHEYYSELPFTPEFAKEQTSKVLAGNIYYWDGWNAFVLNFEDTDIAPYNVVHIGEIKSDKITDILRNSGDKIEVSVKQ